MIVAIGDVYFDHVDVVLGGICANNGLDGVLEGSSKLHGIVWGIWEGFRVNLVERVVGNELGLALSLRNHACWTEA